MAQKKQQQEIPTPSREQIGEWLLKDLSFAISLLNVCRTDKAVFDALLDRVAAASKSQEELEELEKNG